MFAGRPVELVEHHARLYPGHARCRIDVEDAVQILAAIEDDARPDRLAGQAGAAAARGDRHLHLAGDLHGGNEVGHGARNDDAERLDLVNAGVGAVELARSEVETHFALQMLAQVLRQGAAAQFKEFCHASIVQQKRWSASLRGQASTSHGIIAERRSHVGAIGRQYLGEKGLLQRAIFGRNVLPDHWRPYRRGLLCFFAGSFRSGEEVSAIIEKSACAKDRFAAVPAREGLPDDCHILATPQISHSGTVCHDAYPAAIADQRVENVQPTALIG